MPERERWKPKKGERRRGTVEYLGVQQGHPVFEVEGELPQIDQRDDSGLAKEDPTSKTRD
jgi:hypothetical protein